jgi:hypothetical protein
MEFIDYLNQIKKSGTVNEMVFQELINWPYYAYEACTGNGAFLTFKDVLTSGTEFMLDNSYLSSVDAISFEVQYLFNDKLICCDEEVYNSESSRIRGRKKELIFKIEKNRIRNRQILKYPYSGENVNDFLPIINAKEKGKALMSMGFHESATAKFYKVPIFYRLHKTQICMEHKNFEQTFNEKTDKLINKDIIKKL